MKATNTSRRRVISIWSLGPVAKQSNSFLASKWKEALLVLPSWFVGSLQRVGLFIPFLKLEEPKLSITGSLNGLDKTDSHVSLSAEEMEEGRKRLIEIGINPDKPYVCLIVRDSGHYKSKGDIESAGYELLNFDINDFAGVAEVLIESGYQVIRIGKGSFKEANINDRHYFDITNHNFNIITNTIINLTNSTSALISSKYLSREIM
jgi:hypothetical protein